MNFIQKMQRQKMGFPHYIEALEAERRKIQVFSKELPLSLELVTQAIEACRLQLSGTTPSEYNLNGQSECSGQTSSESPVLEEFIPIKKRASSECCYEDEDEDEQHSHKPKIAKDKNTDKGKLDWLRSVQLWNPQYPVKEDVPTKASMLEVKRNGGAFQPFHREASVGKAPSAKPPPPPPPPLVAAASSTAGVVAGGNGGKDKKEEKEGQSQRTQRRCWSQELHKRFLLALQELGGADSATPKQIRELMKVDGLTNDEVKSHLQKFRLHTRRPSPMNMIQNHGNSQTAPFVLVGNIIVQPPEYATAVATSRASGEVTTLTAPPSGIYAPVAAHPPVMTHAPVPAKVQFRQLEHCEHSNSEERRNQSEVADHSNSPTSSSSTHNTTASPRYSI